MLHSQTMILAALMVSASLASPARAELDVWKALGEDALHTKTYTTYNGKPPDIFATCDQAGNLHLPKPYLLDYTLTPRDTRLFERGLRAVKKYASIKAALDDGYLPMKEGFQPGMGLGLLHPDLIKDGVFNFDRPDGLTYVNKKGTGQFRLVGFAYIAGAGEHPPKVANVDFDDKSRRKDAQGKAKTGVWEYGDEVCFQVEPGKSVTVLHGGGTKEHCKGHTFYKRLWYINSWGLVYNPMGLFAETNTVVDWLDHTQKFGPLCPKPQPPAK